MTDVRSLTLCDLYAVTNAIVAPPVQHPRIRRGTREPINADARYGVFERDGWACVWCGEICDLTIDHIQPWSNGGSDWTENLRTLCRSCNLKRGTRVDKVPTRSLPVSPRCQDCRGCKCRCAQCETVLAYCRICGLVSPALLSACL